MQIYWFSARNKVFAASCTVKTRYGTFETDKLKMEVVFVKQTIILGNIITVDDKKPFAKAALVKDGTFAYIGDAQEAKKLADSKA